VIQQSRVGTAVSSIYLGIVRLPWSFGQDANDKVPNGNPIPLAGCGAPPQNMNSKLSNKTDSAEKANPPNRGPVSGVTPAAVGTDGVRRITLEEAQQMAARTNNPTRALWAAQVEIAKQHRLGGAVAVLPSSHDFSQQSPQKQTGQVLTCSTSNRGWDPEHSRKHIRKDETLFDVNAIQPVTPLFAIYQLAKIARADEIIAKRRRECRWRKRRTESRKITSICSSPNGN